MLKLNICALTPLGNVADYLGNIEAFLFSLFCIGRSNLSSFSERFIFIEPFVNQFDFNNTRDIWWHTNFEILHDFLNIILKLVIHLFY